MALKYSRILAIGAHTDDIELGCGGSLSRLARAGAGILCLAFSRAEASLPRGLPPDTLENEFHAAMKLLGDSGNVRAVCKHYPVRRLPEYRQLILEDLVAIRKEFDPDLVITMNSRDTHQDHETIHQESIRAFRGVTVLGYELPWNQQQNVINLFIELEPVDLDLKVKMLNCYQSQEALNRRYVSEEYAASAATFRGLQARKPLAEAFEVITMQWEVQ